MMSVSYFQMAQKNGDRPQTRQNVYKAKENSARPKSYIYKLRIVFIFYLITFLFMSH